jgi:hypothetical protein
MHGDHPGGKHRLDLVARLDPLTTESMKFAPRSNGPLSWEALTEWQIIAAIATPPAPRCALWSKFRTSNGALRVIIGRVDEHDLGGAREGLEFSVERDAADTIDFNASAPARLACAASARMSGMGCAL